MNVNGVGSTLTIGRNSFNVHQQPNSSTTSSITTNAHKQPTPGLDPSIKEPSPVPPPAASGPENSINLTIWFHELRLSPEEILIDQAAVPGFKEGDTIEIKPLVKDGESEVDSPTASLASLAKPNRSRSLYFTIRKQNILPSSKDPIVALAAANPIPPGPGTLKFNFQLSLLSNPLQKYLDLLPRSLVQVSIVSDVTSIEADSIEIFIKDVNLSRDSMWNFSSTLIKSCVYSDQRLPFLNYRTGTVKYIYKDGRKILSAYVGQNTKIIYRSESARLIFLVQLSREMWHFEENGEIMFHKLVNTLFPKIFKRWRDKSTHHSITIVLFTSVDLTDIPWVCFGDGERPNTRRDYFRVVVDQVNIFHWDRIMASLRLEFANFKRDILLNLNNNNPNPQSENSKFSIIDGESLPSVKGNILEAINLGLSLVMDRFRDTDLKHCLNHFVLVTPGTGLFDVDYNLLLETSKKMHSLDMALDLVCLSQPPLHIVPLFRYKDPNRDGKVCHCVPNWCDISFFKDSSDFSGQWIPRCKIYELQMMGVMENNINDLSIERLANFKDPKSVVQSMDNYDEDIFRPIDKKVKKKRKNPEFNPKKSVDKTGERTIVASTLSLINRNPTSAPVVSTAKIEIGTTQSSVLGTVTNVSNEISALSSLYTLNKVTDDSKFKPLSSNASVRSFAALSAIAPRRSAQSGETSLTPVTIGATDKRRHTPETEVKERRDNTDIKDRRDNLKPFGHEHGTFKREMKKNSSDVSLSSMNRKKSNATEAAMPNFDNSNEFWTEIINPSKELHRDVLSFLRIGRWNEVFPPKIRRRQAKWRSFQSPAALPIITPVFPTKNELENDFTFQIYTVTLSWENDFEIETNQNLMREMIQLRLCLGFQVCYGDDVKNVDAQLDRLLKYFPNDSQSLIGARIYLSLDDEIHRICCESNGDINVQLYKKIASNQTASDVTLGCHDYSREGGYTPLIRTRYADEFTPAQIDAINSYPKRYNWNQFDQFLAGYDDAMPEENRQFHKMKFVVIPTEIPNNAYFVSNEKLTDEEIRVEGLRKLIAMIERGKYLKPKERQQRKKKEEILPEISFYTGNLYDFLNDQAETYTNSLMLADGTRFNKTIKLGQIGQELQKPGGVRLVDRTWHFKTHLHCFLGNELVSWFIESYDDIDSREAATEYGQSLMDKGLFKHVENRHGFLDGYYFYEFEDEYIDKSYRSGTGGWFNRKKPPSATNLAEDVLTSLSQLQQDGSRVLSSGSDGSGAKTKSPNFPAQDGSKSRNMSPKILALDGTRVLSGSFSESSSVTDSSKTKSKRKFILSRRAKYDADPLKKSYRPEILYVHYDRVHNPEHCYHIRLQWLNTTTKFVDEAIVSWSRLCERHGLKLIETPWKELCTIPRYNPFHSFVSLKLAINPWMEPEFREDRILKDNKFYYHLYLLSKANFLLDNRSSVFFLKDHIDISYSWGKPIFQFAQYIHETGSYIVELRDSGDFFLAPNNIHLIRLNTLLNSIPDNESNIKNYNIDSQKVMLNFRQTCNDENRLRELFREAKQSWYDDPLNITNI